MVFGLIAMIGALAFQVRFLVRLLLQKLPLICHFQYTVYAGLAALLFMVYLAIDIQMIMGGRKYEISPEDHIFAAIQVFLDIICKCLTIYGLFNLNF